MYWVLDKAVIFMLRLKEEHEDQFASKREDVEHIKHILYDMDVIDGKSSALLTHVSVMLAVVVGILFTVSDDANSLFSIILKTEVVLYASVALFLLRCVDVMGPPFRRVDGEMEAVNIKYRNEILIRRAIYQLMARLVFVLTFILVIATGIKFSVL